jgi:hypothetical protein
MRGKSRELPDSKNFCRYGKLVTGTAAGKALADR